MTDHAAAAERLAAAIQTGNVAALRRVLAEHPELASAALGGRFASRTALHVVSDWPGYFPNGPQTVRILIEAGADPNARSPGDETPLHWAASSDDVEVAKALVDAGADIEAPEGTIGTPLGNAIGYSCWHVAELLLARGARVDQPWHASALGLVDRLAELLGDDPDPEDVSQALWHACAGAQRRAAEYLLSRGGDLSWVPDYASGTPLDAARGRGTRRENLISWLEELGARSS
jgi:ankyrin repeat protein